MKNSILDTLVYYLEEYTTTLSNSKQFVEAQDKITQILNDLTPDLSDKERFDIKMKIDLNEGQMITETADRYFKEGMKSAVRLLLELFTDLS